MPSYRAWEEFGFLKEFLDIVFAEVCLKGVGGLVEGEDVVCGLEFGDGYEAHLRVFVSRVCASRWEVGMMGAHFGHFCWQL